jgi:hypothetical protein
MVLSTTAEVATTAAAVQPGLDDNGSDIRFMHAVTT